MTSRTQRHKAPNKRSPLGPSASWRGLALLALLLCGFGVLIGRIVNLQVVDHAFLQEQGDARTIRMESITAHRGMITDRDGEPLAVSTPVVTLTANPHDLPTDRESLTALAKALGEKPESFIAHIENQRNKGFIYLRRQITPVAAQRVLDLQLPGIDSQHEYKRYYPAGEVTAQMVGVTNIDDRGQEGLEYAYNDWLTGMPGQRRVLKDRKGHWVRDLHLIRDARPGHDLHLSINLRLQYLAYRELLDTVQRHQADAGSLVMMNAQTGEVLAMTSVPSYNPNNRANMDLAGLRSRPITDAIEPGSVMKPLAMSAILESGKFSPNTLLDTSPGYIKVDNYTIRDVRNFGKLTLTGVITKSSNIGMTQLALALPNDALWQFYNTLGLSHALGTGFPGEASGSLPPATAWSKAKRATLAYGYGLSVSPLQLASAYTAVANRGKRLPPSLVKLDHPPEGQQVLADKTSRQVLEMMETVVGPFGGAGKAAIDGYRVAGKTGTVRKVGANGYQAHAYRSNFVGIAPASDPRLIVAICIDNPKVGGYYGGGVAAPLFARVAGPALRMLDVPPDEKRDGSKEAQDAVKVTGIPQPNAAAQAAARSAPND